MLVEEKLTFLGSVESLNFDIEK